MREEYKNQVGLVLKEDSGYESYEVQRLPESVLYVDKSGGLVVSEELVDNGRVTKITSYIPFNPYNTRHWTQEEMEKECTKFTYYISNVDGGYIGTEQEYKLLVEKYKFILIQKAVPTNNACSIGYDPGANKWYGWSHRAVCGFTIGDVAKEGSLVTTSGLAEEYRIQHPEEDYSLPVGYRAKDLNGAKRMAIAYAEAVS